MYSYDMRKTGRCYNQLKGKVKIAQIYMKSWNVEMNCKETKLVFSLGGEQRIKPLSDREKFTYQLPTTQFQNRQKDNGLGQISQQFLYGDDAQFFSETNFSSTL